MRVAIILTVVGLSLGSYGYQLANAAGWMQAHQSSGTITASCSFSASNDFDGDGLTNSQEYAIGTNACNTDTDADGCSDFEEVGSNQSLGGLRDPLNHWDFYDVNSDEKVDAVDIALVRSKFNKKPGDPGYDGQYDRTLGVHPWAPGPPNAKINAIDIALVRAEFNHSCQAPP